MSGETALVVGAGEGIGAALGRLLLDEGMHVALVRRDAEALAGVVHDLAADTGRLRGYPLDATAGDGVGEILDRVEAELGPLSLVIYNLADYVTGPVTELTPAQFEAAGRITHGAFLTARAAASRLAAQGRGSILFTTSTASMKGRAGNAALASARFGMRGLVECLAREMAPAGVHAALVVLDSMIDTPALRAAVPDAADRYGPDRLMPTAAVAEHCLQLHRQPPGAWTFLSELRPRGAEW